MRKKILEIALILFPLILTSCAALRKSSPTTVSNATGQALQEVAGAKEPLENESEEKSKEPNAADIENYTIGEILRMEEPNTANLYDNSRYDFPITMNSRVEGWIDYFTGRGRPHMERYLGRSGRYIPVMKQILKKMGMPEDLVYLALIESGFNMRARSRAKAVGPWQFMKGTGTRYGLRVDTWVDERRDPLRSTEAAARYLKDLYLMFESWYLAASAYNAGEFRILRAIESLKTNNYWRICETRVLRRETKDYIPKLIAAAIIAKNPAKYGFGEVAYQEPLEFETVTVDFPLKLSEIAKIVDAPADEIEELNPHLIHAIVPPNRPTYEVRVPTGTRVLVESALVGLKGTMARGGVPVQHIVRRGDTLRSLSRKYRIQVRDLANANNLGPREKLSPGLTLVIPRRGDTAARETTVQVKRSVSGATEGKDNFVTHTVRSGESLWSISQRYDVTVQDIFRWNRLKKPSIQPGKKLRIQPKNDTETATRSSNEAPKRNRPA